MESRARIALLLEWPSQVVVDVHEMGGNSTYYFPPNAVPGNPWTTDDQNASLRRAGAAMAANFDARGFRYFNRDTYDAFYPGYGTSWPMALGGIGMTFEQASARGMAYRRDDGSLLTYGEGILQHFTATFATTEWAATERERLLREFAEHQRSSAELGAGRSYVLHSSHDPAMARRMAETLVRNGIRVIRPGQPLGLDDRLLDPEATYVVPLDQSSHRLIRNLLDPQTSMDTTFVEEQLRRRSLRLRDQIYDVTAWNLPMLWDVELLDAPGDAGEGGIPVTLGDPDPAPALPSAGVVAWLMPWGAGTAGTVAELLREGATVRVTGAELTLDGRVYPVGTAIVRPSENPDVAGLLARAADRNGAEVVAARSAYTESGSSLGSNATRTLRLPRVLLAWDRPGIHLLRGLGPFRPRATLRPSRDRDPGPDPPSGPPLGLRRRSSCPRGTTGPSSARTWSIDCGVGWRKGGTLVTLAESSRWAGRVGLLRTETEFRDGAATAAGEGGGGPGEPIDPVASLAPAQEAPEPVPGAILNVELDVSHWLASGTDGEIGALVEGSRVFTPLTLDEGVNVGRYAGLDRVGRQRHRLGRVPAPRLAHKAYLMHQPVGSGQLVAFAEDPNYRAYAEASQLLFLNAVLLGPGR